MQKLQKNENLKRRVDKGIKTIKDTGRDIVEANKRTIQTGDTELKQAYDDLKKGNTKEAVKNGTLGVVSKANAIQHPIITTAKNFYDIKKEQADSKKVSEERKGGCAKRKMACGSKVSSGKCGKKMASGSRMPAGQCGKKMACGDKSKSKKCATGSVIYQEGGAFGETYINWGK